MAPRSVGSVPLLFLLVVWWRWQDELVVSELIEHHIPVIWLRDRKPHWVPALHMYLEGCAIAVCALNVLEPHVDPLRSLDGEPLIRQEYAALFSLLPLSLAFALCAPAAPAVSDRIRAAKSDEADKTAAPVAS